MKKLPYEKTLAPLELKPYTPEKLAGLGLIHGEHLEHEVSEATWRAAGNISRKGAVLGWCSPNAEEVQQRWSLGYTEVGKKPRGTKASAELKALGALMLKEINDLRKKGVKGNIPLCVQPSKFSEPGIDVIPLETKTHERFHAENHRRRTQDGARDSVSISDRQECESKNATDAAAKLLGMRNVDIRSSIPDYWATFFSMWSYPEELWARAESTRHICYVQKNAKDCKDITARFHNELKVNASKAPRPNLIRELADELHKRKLTAKDVFSGVGKVCKVGGKAAPSKGSALPPLKPLEPKKKTPKKVAKPAKPVKVLKPKKARKTVAKTPVKKTPKKSTPKKTVRAIAKLSGKHGELV